MPDSAQLPNGPLFGVSDFAVYHQMVRGAGFHDSSVRELPIAWRTSSIDAYVASFRDWANLGAFPRRSKRVSRLLCGREQERTCWETCSSCPTRRFSSSGVK